MTLTGLTQGRQNQRLKITRYQKTSWPLKFMMNKQSIQICENYFSEGKNTHIPPNGMKLRDTKEAGK